MAAATGVRGGVGVRLALAAVAAVGLGVDAYVHFHLAKDYDLNKTSVLSQGELFRAEGVLAILAAVAILVRPRRHTAVAAAAVSGSALVALLVYRYLDIKAIGPIPSMYEPIWFAQKTLSGVAEFASLLSGAALIVLGRRHP